MFAQKRLARAVIAILFDEFNMKHLRRVCSFYLTSIKMADWMKIRWNSLCLSILVGIIIIIEKWDRFFIHPVEECDMWMWFSMCVRILIETITSSHPETTYFLSSDHSNEKIWRFDHSKYGQSKKNTPFFFQKSDFPSSVFFFFLLHKFKKKHLKWNYRSDFLTSKKEVSSIFNF